MKKTKIINTKTNLVFYILDLFVPTQLEKNPHYKIYKEKKSTKKKNNNKIKEEQDIQKKFSNDNDYQKEKKQTKDK